LPFLTSSKGAKTLELIRTFARAKNHLRKSDFFKIHREHLKIKSKMKQ
jgi:hypothetical protein